MSTETAGVGFTEAADTRRRWWERAAFLALFFFIGDLFLTTRNLIGAALRLLVFIVFYQADNPQTPRGARQTLTLTFIQMVAATASTTEVSFAVWMALYLLAFTYTLAALHIAERETGVAPVSPLSPAPPALAPLSPASPAPSLRIPLFRLTAMAAPAIAACGIAVFFVIPHYGTGYFREAARGTLRRSLTGFSERIELGSIGSIKKSHATVMRVRAEGEATPALPLRMRGIALDHYDGRTWSLSESRRKSLQPDAKGSYIVAPGLAPMERERRHAPAWLNLEVILEPLDTHVLFTPPDVVSVSFARFDGVDVDRQSSVFTTGGTLRRFTYRTASLTSRGRRAMTPGAEPPEGVGDYLQLPALDPRIEAMARDFARDAASPIERARALESRLRTDYSYSLDVNDAEVVSPLNHFLIERRPGHCEYFATALAILLRVDGIPSRVVNGFNGGERSDLTGQIILRQSDAHSWVEAWIPDQGWTTLDPTPSDAGDLSLWDVASRLKRGMEQTEILWDTWIVGLDLEDQQGILEDIRDRIDLTLAAIVIHLREAWWGVEQLIGSRRLGPASFLAALFALAAATTAVVLIRLGLRAWSRSRRSRLDHPATRIFRRFEDLCARAGQRREPSLSPGEFARRAGATEVASHFEAARYGEPARQEEALSRLRACVSAFRQPPASPPVPPTWRDPD